MFIASWKLSLKLFFPKDDVLVSEVGLATTFTRRNEFWSPFEVKMTPNQIFFVGVHVHPKTAFMQVFIKIGQNLDFDPYLTPHLMGR